MPNHRLPSAYIRMMLGCVHLIAVLCGSSLHFHLTEDHAHDDDELHTHAVLAHAHETELDFHDGHFVMDDDQSSHHHTVSTIQFIGITISTHRSTPQSSDVTQYLDLFPVPHQTIQPFSSGDMVMVSCFDLPPPDRSFSYSPRAPPIC